MESLIGIIGAGPAGCALACFLKEKNVDCIVFDDQQTPDIIVGESLAPAIIPLLRRLKIEDRVAEVSQLKQGAGFRHGNGNRINFRFQKFGKKYPDYSYNIPRPKFDEIIRERAKELGVRFINYRAGVEVSPQDSKRDIQLTDETLAQAGLTRAQQPSLLVDASGRTRLISKALQIPYARGTRDDVSYFAHYENFDCPSVSTGQVILTVLENGWSWQIPLKDRTSVGVVLDKTAARHYGNSSTERLENIINTNALLTNEGGKRQRISPVKSYQNYQLISKKGYGKGWVLLGDAFGFVDPMLSPGVHMSMTSAELLEKFVFSKPSPSSNDFDNYCNAFKKWYDAWEYLVQFFYDGRMLSMGEVRTNVQNNPALFSIPKLVEPYVSRVLTLLMSGIKTRSKLSQSILFHSCQKIVNDLDRIAAHAIYSSVDTTEQTKVSEQELIVNNTNKTSKKL